MKDFVVYSVLTGNYEVVRQPTVIDSRFDYILFSNDFDSTVGVWEVRPIPLVVKDDNKRLSRYPKTHPETLLAGYCASLYVDANIQILDQWVYDRVVELYRRGVEYAGIKLVLTGRDCIYEHAFDMCQWFVESETTAIKQCHALYKLGFPQHFGLNENNVIYRSHTDRMKAVDEEWWDWIMKYSSRDQFSLMYCLWKYGIELVYFLPEGDDARNGCHFKLFSHDHFCNVQKVKLINYGLLRKLRVKNNYLYPEKALLRWEASYSSRLPVIRLFISEGLSVFSNIPLYLRLLHLCGK